MRVATSILRFSVGDEQTMTASTSPPVEYRSIHERVMSDPESRHAYFHTTEALLTANPDHRDTDAIIEVLDKHDVVYLYDATDVYPRPRLDWLGNLSIGLDEITEAARRISDSRPPPGVCRFCPPSGSAPC